MLEQGSGAGEAATPNSKANLYGGSILDARCQYHFSDVSRVLTISCVLTLLIHKLILELQADWPRPS